MYRTLNCGVGMVICVPSESVETALDILKASGEQAFTLGHIVETLPDGERVKLLGIDT